MNKADVAVSAMLSTLVTAPLPSNASKGASSSNAKKVPGGGQSSKEKFRLRQQVQSASFGEDTIVEILDTTNLDASGNQSRAPEQILGKQQMISQAESLEIASNTSIRSISLRLPGNDRVADAARIVVTATLAELRLATSKATGGDEVQVKKRRTYDPLAVVSERLNRDLCSDTTFYATAMPSLLSVFDLPIIEPRLQVLDTTVKRRQFIDYFCKAMSDKYGGASLKDYIEALDSCAQSIGRK